MKLRSIVQQVPAAGAEEASSYFTERLRFETDCWDVHYAMENGPQDFVLLDVRGEERFAAGHVPGAENLPHRQIDNDRLAAYPEDTLFVTYCAGPHCNAAQRAAAKLAGLGRPVKEMIGGVTGWLDEGFDLASTTR